MDFNNVSNSSDYNSSIFCIPKKEKQYNGSDGELSTGINSSSDSDRDTYDSEEDEEEEEIKLNRLLKQLNIHFVL